MMSVARFNRTMSGGKSDSFSEEKQNCDEARQFSLLTISLYKEHPELWNPYCENYTDKFLRRKALMEITDALKHYNPDFNIRLLRNKINTLRTNFNKEYKKRKQRRLSGNDFEDLPEVWYYDAMLFLRGKSPATTATDSSEGGLYVMGNGLGPKRRKLPKMTEYDEESVLNEKPESCPEEPYSKIEVLEEFDDSDDPGEYPTETVDDESDSIMSHNTNIYQTVTEHDAIGINVAKKLAKMKPDQAIYAESIINNTLRRGLQKKLTDDTNLCENRCNQIKYKYSPDM